MAYGAGDGNWARTMLTETPSVRTSRSKCQPFFRMLSFLQNCGHPVNIIHQNTFLTSTRSCVILLFRLGRNLCLFGIQCSSLHVHKPGYHMWCMYTPHHMMNVMWKLPGKSHNDNAHSKGSSHRKDRHLPNLSKIVQGGKLTCVSLMW